jgi:hypothetical protein
MGKERMNTDIVDQKITEYSQPPFQTSVNELDESQFDLFLTEISTSPLQRITRGSERLWQWLSQGYVDPFAVIGGEARSVLGDVRAGGD